MLQVNAARQDEILIQFTGSEVKRREYAFLGGYQNSIVVKSRGLARNIFAA
jgi:hypothetical protein